MASYTRILNLVFLSNHCNTCFCRRLWVQESLHRIDDETATVSFSWFIMDYLIVLSQIHYWPLYNKDKVTVLQVGEVSHKLIENLDIVTYYAFRIVAKDHSGEQHGCEVLARTLRDGEFCFTLDIKSFIGLLIIWAHGLLSPLFTSHF